VNGFPLIRVLIRLKISKIIHNHFLNPQFHRKATLMLLIGKLYYPGEGGAGGNGGEGNGGAGAGAGGSPENPKIYSESEWKEIQAQRDKIKGEKLALQTEYDTAAAKLKKFEDDALTASGKTSELIENKDKELTETKGKLTKLEADLLEATTKNENLEKTFKKGLLDQLPDGEGKDYAKTLPLDQLTGYVKLHGGSKQKLDGGKGGESIDDIAAKNWNEMSVTEKDKLKEKNPTLYAKKLAERNKK